MSSARRLGSKVGAVALIAGAGVVIYRIWRRWRRTGPVGGSPSPEDRQPVTPSTSPVQPAEADLGQPGRNTEQRLDEALQESFPASDPVSVHIE